MQYLFLIHQHKGTKIVVSLLLLITRTNKNVYIKYISEKTLIDKCTFIDCTYVSMTSTGLTVIRVWKAANRQRISRPASDANFCSNVGFITVILIDGTHFPGRVKEKNYAGFR